MPGMKRSRSPILVVAFLAASLLAISARAAEQQPPSPSPTPGQAEQSQSKSLIEELDLEGLWTANQWGNWLSPLLGILVGLILGKITAAVLRWSGRRLHQRGWTAQEHVVVSLAGPVTLAFLTLGLRVGLANFRMGPTLESFWQNTVLLLLSIAVLWYVSNLTALVEILLRRLRGRTESALDRQLAPLIRKTLRFVVLLLGVLFVADSVFDQDIGAWLAGLGIAGLAVSLAAQDSLKNIFGSITILVDRPFQIGERIAYAGYDGTIEEIGFRSTKLRTLTGNLVTIPNSKITSEPVENIARRPSIRRIINVTITYDTPREKIEQAVQILRGLLEEEGIREPIHPVINGDEFPPKVYFNDFNADSLNIFLIYWYAPPVWWDYMEHAHHLNLRIFEELEKAGIEFAFPTQTVYLAGDAKRRLAVEMLGQDLRPPG